MIIPVIIWVWTISFINMSYPLRFSVGQTVYVQDDDYWYAAKIQIIKFKKGYESYYLDGLTGSYTRNQLASRNPLDDREEADY